MVQTFLMGFGGYTLNTTPFQWDLTGWCWERARPDQRYTPQHRKIRNLLQTGGSRALAASDVTHIDIDIDIDIDIHIHVYMYVYSYIHNTHTHIYIYT